MFQAIQQYFDLNYVIRNLPEFYAGLEWTVMTMFAAMGLAFVWGLLLVVPIMSRHRWIRAPFRAYIEFSRNTPLLLQIFVIYFGLPMIGLLWSAFVCGAIAVAGQHGCYLADVFRGGIEAVSRRQREAARALGMSPWSIMRLVVLPQALLKVLPPVGNQVVLLIKDTSLVSAIGVVELTLIGKQLTEKSATTIEVFVVIALVFLVLTTIAGVLMRVIEERYRARL